MVTICTVLLLAAATAATASPTVQVRTSSQFQTSIKPLVTQCQQQVKASERDVMDIINLRDVATPEAKCAIECTNKLTGILKGGSRFTRYSENPALYDNFFSKEERLKHGKTNLDKCIHKAEGDHSKVPCEPSYIFYKCLSGV